MAVGWSAKSTLGFRHGERRITVFVIFNDQLKRFIDFGHLWHQNSEREEK